MSLEKRKMDPRAQEILARLESVRNGTYGELTPSVAREASPTAPKPKPRPSNSSAGTSSVSSPRPSSVSPQESQSSMSSLSTAISTINLGKENPPLVKKESNLLQFLQQYQETRNAEILKKNEELDKTEPKSKKKSQLKNFRRDRVPPAIINQVEKLPICSKKNELIELIKNNQMLIVIGETGSGKSTQIPQYIADAGLAKNKMIGVTQPRRVAAKSLAERVALECGVELGGLVGYAVRFENCVSSGTLIKYLTDGLLVKECTQGPNLNDYSVIIVDEAHERSIHTDVCFGLLKMAAKKRPDLKIIISSATLEKEKFSKFFNDAPIFSISGKSYPVEIFYQPYPCKYVDAVVAKVEEIHRNENAEGDILVFLTGQDDIEEVWELLEEKIYANRWNMTIVPCHSSLPFETQQQIFEPAAAGFRKVVLATNIAETSITIDGIVYVIDSGYMKERRYNPNTKIETLMRVQVTKFQAIQRQGRAGRTRPGKCFRLYSETAYGYFREAQEPDIQRSNVEAVVLDLIAMGVKNPMEFEFMDAPPPGTMYEALLSLQELSALDRELNLTTLGRQMAGFPLDPPLAKVLVTSSKLGCATDMLKIVAILSTQYQSLVHRGRKKLHRALADENRKRFDQNEGDHLSLLKIFSEFEAAGNVGRAEEWCRANFLQFRILKEAQEIKMQLMAIMIKNKFLTSRGMDLEMCHPALLKENICKAFTAGYFFQLGKKCLKGHAYQKISSSGERKDVFIHPSSALFKLKPQWVVFHEAMETTKAFMKGVIEIKPEWLREYAPDFVKKIENSYGIKI